MGSGGLATGVCLQSQLGRGQSDALARRTEPLPGAGGAVDSIVEAELRQDAAEVVDLHARSVAHAAARAGRPLVRRAVRLIQLHPQLRRPLEDVEELAERQ